MSSVITFYSFKGGVGRSMALANIAVQLARRGKRVLAVDWDLEAPGLHRYFVGRVPEEANTHGLAHLLFAAEETGGASAARLDWHSYVVPVELPDTESL